MNPAVLVAFGDDHPALVAPGKFVGLEGVKSSLGFFSIPQVAEFSSHLNIPDGEGYEANPFGSESLGQPFNVFDQGFRLFFPGAGQGRNFRCLRLRTCSCYK